MDFKELKTKSIIYKNSIFSYRRFGEGHSILLCLHGYGEDSETFAFLDGVLNDEYTVFALDLPFHGGTEWKEPLLFTAEDLIIIIDQITGSASKHFSVLAYSMGGRVALQLLEVIPERIEKLILIAPDGLHHTFWQNLSTRTIIGNKLFAYTMNHPTWVFGLMKLLSKMRLLNKSIFNFVHFYLDDNASRQLLYKRWTTMRKFNPNLHFLKKIITDRKIKVDMLFGKYDRVIVTKYGLRFQKNLKSFITLKELETGHQLLKTKYADDIAVLIRR